MDFRRLPCAYQRGGLMATQCAHGSAIPVEFGGEVVAALCPECDQQLPAEWLTCDHADAVENTMFGDMRRRWLCTGCGVEYSDPPIKASGMGMTGNVTSVVFWVPPRADEVVPDYPPVDITRFVSEIKIEGEIDG
ncbi:hypothetical protein [Actinomadura rudentiformis]|uniref:Uncharacterized protein n=1 Tax=Actinomadura rudentiformis TaxID=359158 RepID=A0A6H9Z0E1_9ACTN|nr:hypothetical protein [Actinomadura rudentiformis]KAB2347331.1 hypothetical protein F8566_20175 [Actinomadura rudentiformis]